MRISSVPRLEDGKLGNRTNCDLLPNVNSWSQRAIKFE